MSWEREHYQELRCESGKTMSQKEKQVLSFGQVEFEVSVGHPSGDVR